MTKKTISQDDYLRLVGLLTLAADHRTALEAIERSARAITGEKDDYGHTADVVWGGTKWSAEKLLETLGITVEQPPSSTTPEQAGDLARRAMAAAAHLDQLFGKE